MNGKEDYGRDYRQKSTVCPSSECNEIQLKGRQPQIGRDQAEMG